MDSEEKIREFLDGNFDITSIKGKDLIKIARYLRDRREELVGRLADVSGEDWHQRYENIIVVTVKEQIANNVPPESGLVQRAIARTLYTITEERKIIAEVEQMLGNYEESMASLIRKSAIIDDAFRDTIDYGTKVRERVPKEAGVWESE